MGWSTKPSWRPCTRRTIPIAGPPSASMTDLNQASPRRHRRLLPPLLSSLATPACASPAISIPARRNGWWPSISAPCPAGRKSRRLKPRAAVLKAEKRVRMTDRVGLARLYIVWPSVPQYTADDAELDVLADVLAGDKTSRLYQRWSARSRSPRGCTRIRTARRSPAFHAGDHGQAGPQPGRSGSGDRWRKFAACRADRPATAAEVARAVNSFESQFVRALESISEFGGRADRLNMYNVLYRRSRLLEQGFRPLREDRCGGGDAGGQQVSGPGPGGGGSDAWAGDHVRCRRVG